MCVCDCVLSRACVCVCGRVCVMVVLRQMSCQLGVSDVACCFEYVCVLCDRQLLWTYVRFLVIAWALFSRNLFRARISTTSFANSSVTL